MKLHYCAEIKHHALGYTTCHFLDEWVCFPPTPPPQVSLPAHHTAARGIFVNSDTIISCFVLGVKFTSPSCAYKALCISLFPICKWGNTLLEAPTFSLIYLPFPELPPSSGISDIHRGSLYQNNHQLPPLKRGTHFH